MNTFWVLDHPDSSDATRRLADWPKDEDLLFRKVDCNVNPEGHRGVRNRITTPLSMLLPDSEPLDFVWTHLGECAVQQPVLEALAERGLTAASTRPPRPATPLSTPGLVDFGADSGLCSSPGTRLFLLPAGTVS